MEISLSLWESTRNRTASQQSYFSHLRPLQVSWQKQTNIWYWAETCPLALRPAAGQKRCSQWTPLPLSQPYLPSSWPANKGIISPDFLQEGIGHRRLSTYRGTLQLWLQLLRLSSLWITNHNAKRDTSRGMRPMLQLSHSKACKKKMHLFLSKLLSRKRTGQTYPSDVHDICWVWSRDPFSSARKGRDTELTAWGQMPKHESRSPSVRGRVTLHGVKEL